MEQQNFPYGRGSVIYETPRNRSPTESNASPTMENEERDLEGEEEESGSFRIEEEARPSSELMRSAFSSDSDVGSVSEYSTATHPQPHIKPATSTTKRPISLPVPPSSKPARTESLCESTLSTSDCPQTVVSPSLPTWPASPISPGWPVSPTLPSHSNPALIKVGKEGFTFSSTPPTPMAHGYECTCNCHAHEDVVKTVDSSVITTRNQQPTTQPAMSVDSFRSGGRTSVKHSCVCGDGHEKGGDRNFMKLGARENGKRNWSYGLFSCYRNRACDIFCLSACCPCIVYGQNKARFDHLSQHVEPQATQDLPWWKSVWSADCLLHGWLTVCFGMSWALECSGRRVIRERYQISGSCLEDFCTSICCTACELTQERLEIQLEEESFYRDSPMAVSPRQVFGSRNHPQVEVVEGSKTAVAVESADSGKRAHSNEKPSIINSLK